MSLGERIKVNFVEIKKGFQIREFHRAVYYFMLLGALVPSFADYFYYYLTEITGITKFQYAMVSVVSYVCLFSAAILYNSCLRSSEVRSMMVLACFTNLFGAVSSLLFIEGIMFGMSPYIFVCVTSAVSEVLYNVFVVLPSQVLFAKMIPSNIESSMFAITTGLTNFANLFASKQLGNLINMYFGVDNENLAEEFWKLYAVQCMMCLLPLLFIWLLPTRK